MERLSRSSTKSRPPWPRQHRGEHLQRVPPSVVHPHAPGSPSTRCDCARASTRLLRARRLGRRLGPHLGRRRRAAPGGAEGLVREREHLVHPHVAHHAQGELRGVHVRGVVGAQRVRPQRLHRGLLAQGGQPVGVRAEERAAEELEGQAAGLVLAGEDVLQQQRALARHLGLGEAGVEEAVGEEAEGSPRSGGRGTRRAGPPSCARPGPRASRRSCR